MQKLYCYIDETGQDTRGEFFLVSAVIFGSERDNVRDLLENIERKTGKGRVKWIRTKEEAKRTYMEAILANEIFRGRLMYMVYRNTTAYPELLAQTTKVAVEKVAEPEYKVTVVVDGLEGRQKQLFTNLIRSLGVRHKTVRGIRDETDAFIRLADALCGFARAGLNNHTVFAPIFKQAQEKGYIVRL